MNHYGKKLDPNRRLKTPKAIKGERREVSITHNPSTIAASQKLIVKFPQLGPNDAIMSGTATPDVRVRAHVQRSRQSR